MKDAPSGEPLGSPGWFTTTHWSVVLNTSSTDPDRAADALSRLCRRYWEPVHRFIRRRGLAPADTEDLTQQFFAQFLRLESYRFARKERGRFRNFLLTAVKHFLANERERARALKRGGGRPVASLDEPSDDEARGPGEPADASTAEWCYERQWALTLIGQARDRLAAAYAAEGKALRFAELERLLPGGDGESTYAETAARLGVAEGTIKSDIHRLKRHYRDLLREEIAQTVASPEEIDDELRHLLAVLGRTGP